MQNLLELAPQPMTLLELQAKVAYQGRMIDNLMTQVAQLRTELARVKPIERDYGGFRD